MLSKEASQGRLAAEVGVRRIYFRFVATTLSVAVAGLAFASPARADVSKEYARQSWDNSACRTYPLEDKLVLGDITGDGKRDAVMLWTCNSGAGGAQPRILSYWIDGNPIRQFRLTLPLPATSSLAIRKGNVVVKGGTYSSSGVPLCCPDMKVTLTYRWNGKKLALVSEQRR